MIRRFLGWLRRDEHNPKFCRCCPRVWACMVDCLASHDFEAMNAVSSVELWECFACGAAV